MQEIALFYQAQLPLNIPAQSYLQQRGLSPEIIARFQIGYVPNAMDTVLRQFGKNREEQKKLLDLGMLSRTIVAMCTINSVIVLCFRFGINVVVRSLLEDVF